MVARQDFVSFFGLCFRSLAEDLSLARGEGTRLSSLVAVSKWEMCSKPFYICFSHVLFVYIEDSQSEMVGP